MLSFNAETLSQLAVTPTVDIREVAVDLQDDRATALRHIGDNYYSIAIRG